VRYRTGRGEKVSPSFLTQIFYCRGERRGSSRVSWPKRRRGRDRALARPLHNCATPRRPPRGLRGVSRLPAMPTSSRLRERRERDAKEHGDLLIEGKRRRRRRPAAGSKRSAGIVVGRRTSRQSLISALAAARPADIQIVRARVRHRSRAEAAARGADSVVMPYTAAGRTMANIVLKPAGDDRSR